MKTNMLENCILETKKFINSGSRSDADFEAMALKLYRLHHEMNDYYYSICGRKIASNLDDIPLMPINNLSAGQNLGLKIDTKMPYPGIVLKTNSSEHYIRDTELYKYNIAKSFPKNILNEDDWVPWINYVGIAKYSEQSLENYIIEYIFESFHGTYLNEINDFAQLVEKLVEKENEEIKVKIPTVFMVTSVMIQELVKKYNAESKNYVDGIHLPLGSMFIELKEISAKSSLEDIYNICNIFDLNSIIKLAYVPGLTSQFYSLTKKSILESCKYNKLPETTEYFFSPWIRVRVVDEKNNNDVKTGQYGKIAIYDLANFWSCPFILTNYYGKIGPRGGIIIKET